MAISSILHRISGIVLFFLLPLIIYYFEMSLKNAGTFAELQRWITTEFFCKLSLWAFGAAMIYHVLAGIRHLVMDAGYGEDLRAGRYSATTVMGIALVLTLLLGVWLW